MTKAQLTRIAEKLDLPEGWVVIEVLPRAKQNPITMGMARGPVGDFILLGWHKWTETRLSEAESILKQLNTKFKQSTEWKWCIGEDPHGAYYDVQNFVANEWDD